MKDGDSKRRRRFNLSERVAMFLLSGGRCSSCGCDLKSGWHGDHYIPFSRGGETDVVNGQALCPPCNLRKGASVVDNKVELRDWQEQGLLAAVAKFKSGEKVFGAGVSVGGGKTFFGSAIAAGLKEKGMIDNAVVVSPGETIQTGWADDMSKIFDINIRSGEGNGNLQFGIPPSEFGYSTTYQSVGAQPTLHRSLAMTRGIAGRACRTLLILDEAHHIGVDSGGNPTTWAKSIIDAFGDVSYILVLTGTPGRTDGSRIPFLEYRDGEAVLDVAFAYGEAVNGRIVRRCVFNPVEATGKVEIDDGVTITSSTGDTANKARTAVEKAALNYDYVKSSNGEIGAGANHIIDAAMAELEGVKIKHQRAAALAVCDNISHAEYISACLRARGVRHVVVTGDDSKAADIIREFKESDVPWIVAVQMVAEGVNIKRLRVCAYLTRRSTPLALEQIMGRVVRIDPMDAKNPLGEDVEFDDVTGEDIPGDAVFVHLNKPELLMWIATVEEEIKASAIDKDDTEDREYCVPPEPQTMPEYDVSDVRAESRGEVIMGIDFDQNVVTLARELKENAGTDGSRLDMNRLAKYVIENVMPKQVGPHAPQSAPHVESNREECARLRKASGNLVKRICAIRSMNHRDLHIWANQQAGILRGVMSADAGQLRIKVAVLERYNLEYAA